MQAKITTTDHVRIVTLLPDENGNSTAEAFDRAFYEASEQPAGSLQELLERIQEKLRQARC